MKKISIEKLLKEAKSSKYAKKCGMFLVHNGVVRESAKAKVRNGASINKKVKKMLLTCDSKKASYYIKKTKNLTGIYYVNILINEGLLNLSDDIMYVVIGGDIRPHVVKALNYLVSNIKKHCVDEKEIF